MSLRLLVFLALFALVMVCGTAYLLTLSERTHGFWAAVKASVGLLATIPWLLWIARVVSLVARIMHGFTINLRDRFKQTAFMRPRADLLDGAAFLPDLTSRPWSVV